MPPPAGACRSRQAPASLVFDLPRPSVVFATLPLSYCANVHPGLTVEAVCRGLTEYTQPLASRVGPVAAGLWLPDPVARELEANTTALAKLRETLAAAELPCYTLNAFPQGNFHDTVVKQAVYRPTWGDRSRLDYTLRCARLLTELMPEGVQGSISTVPLAYKRDESFVGEATAIEHLLECAHQLDALHDETGRVVRLAIEPEPHCHLETTDEAVAFFGRLFEAAAAAGCEAIARDHLGLCYDVCHQSVEFEDVVRSVRALDAAGVRINKVHISCAIELTDPTDAQQRAALATYAEPRYLHQTFAQTTDRRIVSVADLTAELCESPPEDFAAARRWRIHFHVPVDADRLGPLRTTRPDLSRAMAAIRELSYAPHLEVETYTWSVLPGEASESERLIEGLAREVTATRRLIDQLSAAPPAKS